VQIGELKKTESTASTANRYLGLIRSVLRSAAGPWEWIERVPHIALYKEPKRRIRWLTPEQRQALLAALPKHQRAYVEFALETGLRQGNVIRLEWEQVDLSRQVCWIYADQAKCDEPIGVPLTERAVEILSGECGKHKSRVFTYRGRPVGQANTKAWKKALRAVGLDGFRWHDLRHAWASAHIMSGTTTAELQELGSWKSEAMVRRYAHLAPDHLRRAAAKSSEFWRTPATFSPHQAEDGGGDAT
jgi:integrase